MLLLFNPAAVFASTGSNPSNPSNPSGPSNGATKMTAQGSAALNGNDITLGNATMFYAPAFSSLADAQAATSWRKVGMMKSNITITGDQTTLDFVSGVPAGLVKRFITAQDFAISGDLLEWRPENLALILGSIPLIRTLKTSPAPTTIAATPASTKTVLQLTSATGFAKEDAIQVGTQYGRIKSITGNVATLYEGLSADVAPASGAAVSKIDTSTIALGLQQSPQNVAIKLSHNLAGGNGSYDIYILNGQFSANLNIAFQDNNKSPEGIALPFNVAAFRDDAIENGNIAFFVHTQN